MLLVLLMATASVAKPQRNRLPKMAPIFSDGYYVSSRGDTVRGKIQVNPENETDFHKQFSFKAKGQSKSRPFNFQRAKAYGFDGKHFVAVEIDGDKFFIERLVRGRLNFYERRLHGKVDGNPAVVSVYYIKDNDAEGPTQDLARLKKISGQFYKRNLKPYMVDQPMIWDDLDKYKFDRQKVLQAIREFNGFYPRQRS
jgi:hypothetical protein